MRLTPEKANNDELEVEELGENSISLEGLLEFAEKERLHFTNKEPSMKRFREVLNKNSEY